MIGADHNCMSSWHMESEGLSTATLRVEKVRGYVEKLYTLYLSLIFCTRINKSTLLLTPPLICVRLATGWTVRGSNSGGGGRDFPHPSIRALGSTQPPIHGYWVLPGGKAAGARS